MDTLQRGKFNVIKSAQPILYISVCVWGESKEVPIYNSSNMQLACYFTGSGPWRTKKGTDHMPFYSYGERLLFQNCLMRTLFYLFKSTTVLERNMGSCFKPSYTPCPPVSVLSMLTVALQGFRQEAFPPPSWRHRGWIWSCLHGWHVVAVSYSPSSVVAAETGTIY